MKFVFDDKFMQAFEALKRKLIESLILTSPNWELHFELICDAGDVGVGSVLGKRKEIGVSLHILYKQNTRCGPKQLQSDSKRNARLGLCF